MYSPLAIESMKTIPLGSGLLVVGLYHLRDDYRSDPRALGPASVARFENAVPDRFGDLRPVVGDREPATRLLLGVVRPRTLDRPSDPDDVYVLFERTPGV